MRQLNWGKLRDQSVVALVALLFAGLFIWLIGHVIGIVLLVAIAVVIALALEPLMVLMERAMPRLAAALAVYAVFLGTLTVIGFLLVPALISQGSQLAQHVPDYVHRADGFVNSRAARYGVTVPPMIGQAGILSKLGFGTGSSGAVQALVMQALQIASRIANATAGVIVTLVLAFYFMVDGRRMREGFARFFPRHQQPRIRLVEETISQVLGAYIRSQLIMAALMAISAGLGCWLLGVKYPAVIGVLAFGAELVPMIGPFLAAIPAMLIAIFQSFGLMVEVTFFFVGMQMLENNVVRPRITGPMVGLHPVEALLALVVGAETAGFWGALFAVPAVGIAVVLVTVAWKSWRGEPIEFERRGMKLKVPSRDRAGGPEGPPTKAA
ncbi:MAG: AI-2E family transporter [Candidatus Dormibacteraceae bacterium]